MAEKKQSRFTKITTIILFAFLVLSFGLWGIGDIFRGPGRESVVAEVADIEISTASYDAALRREVRNLQESAGYSLTAEQLQALGVQQRALQPLVQQALLQAWAQDRGLVVTQAQLLAAIAAEPTFQNNGRFDQDRYLRALQQAGFTEQGFLALLATDLQRAHLLDPAKESADLPEDEVRRLFVHLAEERVADYLLVDSSAITELPVPTAEELQQVYQDYAADFEAPEYRRVTLLHLTPDSFLDEISVDDAAARAYFEANPDRFATPERRALRQVIVDDQAAAEAALAELAAGKSLEEVATTLGTSPATLAAQSQQQLSAVLPGLGEAVFAVPAGERYGSAETVLGWHVFEVTEIAPGSTRSFEDSRAEIVSELTLQGAKEALGSVADQVDSELSSGATLAEVTERLNLPLVQIEAVDRQGRDRSGADVPLPSPPQVLPLLFEAEIGVESLLSQAADGSWFAYRVDDIVEPALRPFAEVEDQVTTLWERLTRDRLARDQAWALAARINQEGATLAEIAAELQLETATTGALTRDETSPEATPSAELAAQLFQAKVGQAVTASADDGTVVAVLTEVRSTQPDEDAERFSQLKGNAKRGLESDLVTLMLRSLELEYPVEVNQQILDEALGTY